MSLSNSSQILGLINDSVFRISQHIHSGNPNYDARELYDLIGYFEFNLPILKQYKELLKNDI